MNRRFERKVRRVGADSRELSERMNLSITDEESTTSWSRLRPTEVAKDPSLEAAYKSAFARARPLGEDSATALLANEATPGGKEPGDQQVIAVATSSESTTVDIL
jgi:hypothetical protein